MSDDMVEVTCAACTVRFCLTKIMYDIRRDAGGEFYCPAGHSLSFPKPNDDPVKLRERIAVLEAEVRGLKVEKAQLTHELDQLKARHGAET